MNMNGWMSSNVMQNQSKGHKSRSRRGAGEKIDCTRPGVWIPLGECQRDALPPPAGSEKAKLVSKDGAVSVAFFVSRS